MANKWHHLNPRGLLRKRPVREVLQPKEATYFIHRRRHMSTPQSTESCDCEQQVRQQVNLLACFMASIKNYNDFNQIRQ